MGRKKAVFEERVKYYFKEGKKIAGGLIKKDKNEVKVG